MKFLTLTTALSILATIQAVPNVKIVTETVMATVYPNGDLVNPPSSTSSLSTSSSVEVQTTHKAKVAHTSQTPSPTTEQPEPTTEKADPTPQEKAKAPTTVVSKSSPSPTKESSSEEDSGSSGDSDSSGDSSSIGDVEDKDFAKSILEAHNKKRSEHGASPLEWDSKLYEYAKKTADSYSCSGSLQHTGGEYGENLAVGYDTGVKALDTWYDEGKSYDYSSASTFNHFTQVIWKESTKLGCAYKDCSSSNWGKYVICEYDPAGNMIGNGKANLQA